MEWLKRFAEQAEKTDKFSGNPDHAALLATGLFGEAGSVLSELKKERRERDAYPAYRRRMMEEVGDFLWYFVRLVSVVNRGLLDELEPPTQARANDSEEGSLPLFLGLGAATGDILAVVSKRHLVDKAKELRPRFVHAWRVFLHAAQEAGVEVERAAVANLAKVESRWPADRRPSALFDEAYPEWEQLPRQLDVEFKELPRGEQRVVILRCNGVNFGDRLTDNILDPDGYRFHDVFHLSYAAHLGWSPVVRSLLRCKRKSNSRVDEAQDGARAGIIEEAVSAIVFSRAKQLGYFDGIPSVDYDLLKTVNEFVSGFEVESVPLWQWEEAILVGYRTFRALRDNHGGRVVVDLRRRTLAFVASA